MKPKKTTTFTIIVLVTAMAVFAIVITWMSSNLPGTGGNISDNGHIEETGPHTPEETYEYPGTVVQPPPDDISGSDDMSIGNEGYPETVSGGDEDYTDTISDTSSDATLPEDYHEPPTPIFTSEPLPQHIIDQITGVTFHESTPFGYDYLTYLTVTHVNFYGESVIGHLIVAADIGYEVLDIFREIYEGRFPIHSIMLIDYFDASDYYSMAANNSHAFNFRYIAGTNIISRHGFGIAIDINPIQNPYIRGDTVWPAAGVAYLDRSYVRPGMIIPGDVVYTAFISRGWIWGGHWTTPRDYHHFERRR